MTKSTVYFSSAREKHSFETGIALARRKLAGHHRETAAERSARCIREGEDLIVQRLGSAAALKNFGIKSNPQARRFEAIVDAVVSKALASRPRTSSSKAEPSKETALPVSTNPRATYKFMSVSFGREQTARRLAAID
jgi:hypothetical protein